MCHVSTTNIKLNFIYASKPNLRKIVHHNPSLQVGSSSIAVSDSVRNLGVCLDSSLSMANHITQTARSMYLHLRSIRHVRFYLNKETCNKAVMATVISRFDYCNSLMCGMSDHSVHRLQVAQNCAARVICKISRSEHITPVLFELHWLPVACRIRFKTLLLVCKALNVDQSPTYLEEMFIPYQRGRVRVLRSTDDPSVLSVRRTRNSYGDRAFSVLCSKEVEQSST